MRTTAAIVMQIKLRRNISRRYHRRVATPLRVARRPFERDRIGRGLARLDRN